MLLCSVFSLRFCWWWFLVIYFMFLSTEIVWTTKGRARPPRFYHTGCFKAYTTLPKRQQEGSLRGEDPSLFLCPRLCHPLVTQLFQPMPDGLSPLCSFIGPIPWWRQHGSGELLKHSEKVLPWHRTDIPLLEPRSTCSALDPITLADWSSHWIGLFFLCCHLHNTQLSVTLTGLLFFPPVLLFSWSGNYKKRISLSAIILW